MLALTAVLTGAALHESRTLSAVLSPEVWVHLRTGLWILQEQSLPHNGLFSQYLGSKWNDSTWGLDVLLAVGYRFFGLRAIPILLIALKAALALAMFLLARSERGGFWGALFLAAAAQYVMAPVQPLPYVFSILFFATELKVLLRVRRSGDLRGLYWLPALFLIWANLHLQFISGLVLLALFLVALLTERWLGNLGASWLSRFPPIRLGKVSCLAGLSLVATLVNPYSFRLLTGAFRTLYSTVGFEHFTEMSSMAFRQPRDYARMLVVMAAFLALGRRRSLHLFELIILLAGTLVGFRMQRDAWLAVIPAVAVLSGGFVFNGRDRDSSRRPAWERAGVAILSASALFVAVMLVPSPPILLGKASQKFPVKACDYIREHRLSGPLFNDYLWGSFLTWYLPEYPVVVDSRVELYGERILASYFDVVDGKMRLESAPMAAGAGTLLLERNSAMAEAITNLPGLKSQYQLVYSDDIASVFVPQGPAQ